MKIFKSMLALAIIAGLGIMAGCSGETAGTDNTAPVNPKMVEEEEPAPAAE